MPSTSAFTLTGVQQEKAGIRILHDISIALPASQVTALIGPSGAGKSALLRLLNRLDDPVAGDIDYQGRSIVDIPIRVLRRRIGFVFQTPVMFPGTVRDNLEVAASIADVPAAEVPGRIAESLELAELNGELAHRIGDRLSVGQKQRANIARALMTRPETLLLDEPTASLDPGTADKLGQTIARLSRDRGLTVILATHRLAEAKAICTNFVKLDQGRVVND